VSSPEATAFHEAGHAVAALSVGLKVVSITIERTVRGGSNWQIFAGLTQVHLDEADAQRTALVYLAGPAASKRYRDEYQPGMDEDFLAADRAIDAAAGECRSISAYAHRRARIALHVRAAALHIAEGYWPEVSAIANALLELKTIEGDAVVRIFERSLRARGAS
jgi:ATP-dependent Zn protease